jgi:hypothetical protein
MRLLFWFILPLCALEFPSFKGLSEHLTSDTVLLLDIDDTLLITKQMLGCDEWFNIRVKKQGLEKALAEWEGIRHLTQMEIVEEGTEKLISALQKKGVRVMGLTTQGLALATRTVHQLQEQGIDLSLTAPSVEDIYLSNKGHGVIFRHGILFTSGTHKGEAFFQLCKQIGYTPKRVVFVNDKASHIAELESAAKSRGVEFLGLRYAYSDQRKAAFSPEIAEIQFTRSSPAYLLSDDEARCILDECKAALHDQIIGIGEN